VRKRTADVACTDDANSRHQCILVRLTIDD
jgi:hypothetical protein